MNFKTKLGSVLAVTALLSGGGGVANAAPAQAYTKWDCIQSHDYWGSPIESCYYDFNWWEENRPWNRKVDGYYTSPRAIWAMKVGVDTTSEV